MIEEEWRDIKDFEGFYEISNLGNVKRVDRTWVDSAGRTHRVAEMLMKVDQFGRTIVHRDDEYIPLCVRSLVAEAFLGVPYGEDITHLNGDPLDARAENLVSTEKFRTMDPDWKDIPGWEGWYQASRFGEVRSLDRYVPSQGGIKFCKGVVKAIDRRTDGYLQTTLYSPDRKEVRDTHVFIAKTWLPNPEDKPTVNHINGIKDDNRVENLEWATWEEQQEHALRTGLRQKSYWSLEKNGPVGGDWNTSRQIRVRCIETGEEFESISEAGRAKGLSAPEIKRSIDCHVLFQVGCILLKQMNLIINSEYMISKAKFGTTFLDMRASTNSLIRSD